LALWETEFPILFETESALKIHYSVYINFFVTWLANWLLYLFF